MNRAAFFLVTAVVEIGTGLFMVILPGVPLSLLLGISSSAPETIIIARVAGAALFAIGVASAMARHDRGSPALRGVLAGILIYDAAAAALLAYAGAGMQMAGPALWPAVMLHAVLAVWCLLGLRSEPAP
jgi:phosphotransferase system  glucose/maltose/N-acetylglucosamine-specific IIC component